VGISFILALLQDWAGPGEYVQVKATLRLCIPKWELTMNSRKHLTINPVWACLPLAFGLAGCDFSLGPSIRGSGVAKSETREVGDFSEIEVGNAVQLDATVGPPNSLVVTWDDNLLPQLKTVVVGKRLKIYVDGSCSTNLGMQVKATSPALTALVASGAATTTVSGMRGSKFELDLSGASHCELSGDSDLLDATLSGASRGTIAGEARQLTAECSGASQLDARDLTVEKATVELSGASTGRVTVAKELVAEASGASTLHYGGEPAELKKQVSGASTIAPEPSNRGKGDRKVLAEDPLE
jgi:hypothetical protein